MNATTPKPRRASLRLTPLGGTITGAYVGAMGPAMIIGMIGGMEQTDGAVGWLSIPLGVLSGPMILLGELSRLVEGESIFAMRIVPWVLLAVPLCAWIGRRWAQALTAPASPSRSARN